MAWHEALSKKYQIRGKGKKSVSEKKARLSNHRRTVVNGVAFPSAFEATIYTELLFKEKAGIIKDIRLQQSIHLAGKFRWKADFVVFDIERGCDVAHEAKGVVGERFKAVLQLWPELGPMPLIVYYQQRHSYMIKEFKGK